MNDYLISKDEEKTEKNTSTAEKILAIALAVFLLIGGLYIAESINRLFEYPNYGLIRQEYISVEMENEIQSIRGKYYNLQSVVQQKATLETTARIEYEKAREEYRTLLDQGIDDATKRAKWEQTRDYLEQVQKDKEAAETAQKKFQTETLGPKEKAFGEAEQKFQADYNQQLNTRNLKSGIFLLLYALIGFILSFLIYNFFRTRAGFSRYAIIGLSFLGFGALQFLIISFRIVYPFLRGIIPVNLIVSVGGTIISIAGIVYLKNRFFSLPAVRNRRLWKRVCPVCGFPNPGKFCGWCGSEQFVECSDCKKLTDKYLPRCKECGEKL